MNDATFKQAFATRFYELWEDEGFGPPDDHFANPEPWGRPWLWGESYPMIEGPIKSAKEYFAKVLPRIIEARKL